MSRAVSCSTASATGPGSNVKRRHPNLIHLPIPHLPAILWMALVCFDGFSQIKVDRRQHGGVGAVGQETDAMLDIIVRLFRSRGEIADGDPFLFRPFYDVL